MTTTRRSRDINVNVRMTEEERAKLHAIADDRDLSASTLLRHYIREAYAARFGAAPPPAEADAPKAIARGAR